MQIQHKLASGIEKLGIDVSPEQLQQLLDYLTLLKKWNKAYNLTAVRELDAMVTYHLLDSLSLVAYIQSQGLSIIDVGTGAGIPGIPLAIVLPENKFTLLDSNGKKTRFLMQAKIELGLDNCSVVNSRVEDYRPESGFDIVLSRAFTSLESFARITHQLSATDGRFFAMKGKYPQQELDELPAKFQVAQIEALQVPDLNEERHLVVFHT